MHVQANFNYTVKIQGSAEYTSETLSASLTVGEEQEGVSFEEARQAGHEQLAHLANEVKQFVLLQAGMQGIEDENGIIRPVFEEGKVTVTPEPPPAQAPAPRQIATNGQLTWDGRPVRIFDNRAEAMVAGSRKPHLKIMFLDVDESAPPKVRYKGFWPTNVDGTPSQQYQDALALLLASQGQ